MNNPLVDVIIPVHNPTRQVFRAVSSLRQAAGNTGFSRLRILVVTHNLQASELEDYAALADMPVEYLECRRPAGSAGWPRNLALEHLEAPWVLTLDSDDYLEPGALTSWLQLAKVSGVKAVIPRQKREGSGIARTPVVRPRFSILAPLRTPSPLSPYLDRLYYRVGHLGLTARSVIEKLGLRYGTEKVGEDLWFSYPLWLSGEPVIYAGAAPAYVVGQQGAARATTEMLSVGEEFAAVLGFLASPVFDSAPGRIQAGIVTKTIRGQLAAFVTRREDWPGWNSQVRLELSSCAQAIANAAPAGLADLSRAEFRLWEACADPQIPLADLVAASRARRRFGAPNTLVAFKPGHCLHPQAPLRFMAASALMR